MIRRLLRKVAKKIEAVSRNIASTLQDKEVPRRIQYAIDGFILDLGIGHMLPTYQRQFPMYDRFVPVLGELAASQQNAGRGYSLILARM